MDIIIRHIIDIDKRANEIMRGTQKRIDESQKETRASIENMKKDVLDRARAKSRELYNSIIEDAGMEAEKIRAMSQVDCVSVENNFLKVKQNLVDRIFNEIFNITVGDNRE